MYINYLPYTTLLNLEMMKKLSICKMPNSISDTTKEDYRVQGLRILAIIIAREYLARARDKTKKADGSSRKQQ